MGRGSSWSGAALDALRWRLGQWLRHPSVDRLEGRLARPRVAFGSPDRVEGRLEVGPEPDRQDDVQNEADPTVDRLAAGHPCGPLDSLRPAPVTDEGGHDDQRAGEEREQRRRRTLAEVISARPAEVPQLAVDAVPPDEAVDAEGDDREERRRPRAAQLHLRG